LSATKVVPSLISVLSFSPLIFSFCPRPFAQFLRAQSKDDVDQWKLRLERSGVEWSDLKEKMAEGHATREDSSDDFDSD
jgi:hypothetical protein